MIKDICSRIRSQLFFYIDNELKEVKRIELVSHLNECIDCQKFYDNEQEIKRKICQKLKDSYICKCDINKLKNNIEKGISGLISKD